MNPKKTAEELRQLADWLEEHGEALGNSISAGSVYAWGADHTKALALPGPWEKEYLDSMLYLNRRFGDSRLSVPVLRSKVCEMVPTGNKVTKKVPTAWEEVEEDEYEWECSPLLEGVAGE